MTTILHAQPYDLAAAGFYFETTEEFAAKSAALRNDYGDPVEEFEIQFIDGDAIDCDLAKAIGVNQANISQFFACVEAWGDHDKTKVIIAVGECGYGTRGHRRLAGVRGYEGHRFDFRQIVGAERSGHHPHPDFPHGANAASPYAID